MSDENKIKIKTVEEHDSTAEAEGIEDVSIEVLESITEKARKPHPIERRRQAFELFMDHTPYRKICEATGIPMGTLLNWITRGKWADHKRENDEKALKEALGTKASMFNSLVLEILDGAMKAVKRDTKSGGFSSKDLPNYLSALTSLEKLSRLSQGLATSISEERSKKARFVLPAEHLKHIGSVQINDPFATQDVKDGEVVEHVLADTKSDS